MSNRAVTVVCSAYCPGCTELVGLAAEQCVIYSDRTGWVLGWQCPGCHEKRAEGLSPFRVMRYEACGVLRLDRSDTPPVGEAWSADEVLDTLERIDAQEAPPLE